MGRRSWEGHSGAMLYCAALSNQSTGAMRQVPFSGTSTRRHVVVRSLDRPPRASPLNPNKKLVSFDELFDELNHGECRKTKNCAKMQPIK